MIKCAHGCNYYGARDAMISGRETGEEYLHCSNVETRDHAINCREVKSLQREFVKKTAEDLFRLNAQNIEEETILNMLEDIVIFFEDGEEDKHEASQQYAGIREIFYGFIVKDWEGANFNCDRCKELNIIIVASAFRF